MTVKRAFARPGVNVGTKVRGNFEGNLNVGEILRFMFG